MVNTVVGVTRKLFSSLRQMHMSGSAVLHTQCESLVVVRPIAVDLGAVLSVVPTCSRYTFSAWI